MLPTKCVLTVFLLVCLQATYGQMEIDLRRGLATPLIDGVTWVSPLTPGSGDCTCDRQAVLKLNFQHENRKRLLINMTFEKSEGFTFNLGDSDTNNGWAGDGATQYNDAEVHSVDNTLQFYGRDIRPGLSHGKIHIEGDFVGVQPNTKLYLDVKDETVRVSNGQNFIHVQSNWFFQLSGQPDPQGIEYDLYLGLNRVIDGNYRSGVGLCHVTIQFLAS